MYLQKHKSTKAQKHKMDTQTKNTTYKIRVIYVGEEEYGFDDVDLLLINLTSNLVIGEYMGPDENLDNDHFTREDFDFY